MLLDFQPERLLCFLAENTSKLRPGLFKEHMSAEHSEEVSKAILVAKTMAKLDEDLAFDLQQEENAKQADFLEEQKDNEGYEMMEVDASYALHEPVYYGERSAFESPLSS